MVLLYQDRRLSLQQRAQDNDFSRVVGHRKLSLSTTLSPVEGGTTITSLFHQQVKLHGRDPAIDVDGKGITSYSSLDKASHIVASSLPAHKTVAICLERSLHLLIAVFGVLKAGSAYVILDPAAPAERNNLIVQDVNAITVLTSEEHLSFFPNAMTVEELINRVSQFGRLPKLLVIDPSSPAYVIYTSGSSGKPKGVVVSHRAATAGITHYSLNGKLRWLFFYNPIFSAAQRTMLATLCKGGILCIASKEDLTTSLLEVMQRMSINGVGLTPSMLSSLSPDRVPASLKQITLVGEPVSRKIADTFVDKLELRTSYGLSECAQLNFNRRLSRGDNPTLVGKPTDTTNAIVLLPETNTIATLGETGELCLIGPQLADGYLNRLVETRESFVANPFGPGTMFRTGDLARNTTEGFEIVGRIDNQIKINGQRLEPEEVSSVLSRHPTVAQVYALAVDRDDKKYLAAAVVLHLGVKKWDETISELKNLAQTSLPSYMIPTYWVQYQDLPLNPNGKVDKIAIKIRVETVSTEELLVRSSTFEEVEDSVEGIIQDIWANILSIDKSSIGRNDIFLDLGGSSIQAIQMLNELRKVGINLTLESVFRRESLSTFREGALMDLENKNILPFSLIQDDELLQVIRSQPGVVDAFPATDFQEGLVAITLQGSADYTYQRMWDISDLDPIRLRLALQIAFLKSQNLRTTFMSGDAGLIQIVRSDMAFPLEISKLSLEEYRVQDLKRNFDLGEPFFRAAVVQNTVLVITMHHALFDYWSHFFLYEDVNKYYDGLQPDPRPGFQNFVAKMLSTDWKPSESFWRENLEAASPSVLNFAPTIAANSVHRSSMVDLSSIALSNGVTTGAVVYTAWALVLAQHMGSNDVVFAAPLSGRDTPLVGIDRLEGPTLTVAPLRYVLDPKESLKEALQLGQTLTIDVLKHSQYGLRRILKSAPQKAQLFDTMVNILPAAGQSGNGIFKMHGEKPEWKTEYTTLEIEQSSGRLLARLNSTMEARRAGYILDQFIMVIQILQHEPQRPVSTLNLITDAEKSVMSQQVQIPMNLPATMLTRYDEIARRFPHRTALQWQTIESISYESFDARANQLARYLTSHGVKKGDLVSLMLRKSPMMIIAIWGVLKAGAAYVPLDPENPVDRNRFIVDEVDSKLVLSEKEETDKASELQRRLILLDSIDLASIDNRPLNVEIRSNDLAYIIYTSGSTGKPKGVLIPHGAAASAIESMVQYEGRKRGTWRALQFSNYIFDASVLEIFNTLTSGGTLCIAPSDRLLSELAQVINEMTVTHVFFTPTVARLLTPKEVPNLRSMTVGGEALTEDLINIWGNDCLIIQAYGPTETAIAATMRDMEHDHRMNNLGKPFPTVQAYVLERDGEGLVPYGAVGELCLAGPQLGLGYFNRPENTAAAFVRSELAKNNMLYRTGDLARWLEGGEIQYLGRKDHQVKVNGHRIELGEIERAMVAAGNLVDCVAVVANIEGKSQIAAYPVFKASSETGIQDPMAFVDRVADLRNNLVGLAHYMYPKVVLPLCSLPLMPSGKANRKLLVSWADNLETATASKYYFDFFGGPSHKVAVDTRYERFMEEAFIAILKVTPDVLGKKANFLALGGDSISAISLASYTRKHGYVLPVSKILKNPVLENMAKECDESDENASETSTVVAFEPPQSVNEEMERENLAGDDVEYIYPCPPGQAEFLSQGDTDAKGWVLMTVRPFPSSHDLDEWIHTVELLTQTNDILRTTFTNQHGSWYGVVLKSAAITLELIDVTNESEKESHIQRIYSSRFTFGQPFIRYAALRSPSGTIDLVTKMDHGLYDGTLLRTFGAHFRDLQHTGSAGPISPFKDFAFHIHSLTTQKQRALSYFTQNGRAVGLQYPRVSNPSATRSLFVSDTLAVDDFATKAGVTVPILFQAAFQAWLAKATGRQRVGLDYLYTGRNVDLPNPQEINGCTANFLPLQASVTGTVASYLSATQAEFWETTDHGVVGLDEIFAAAGLNRERNMNRSLFLFQPFDPVPPGKAASEGEDMRWVFMAGSRVTMMQPYGLVVEVGQMVEGHRIKVTFDERAFNEEGAKMCGRGIWDITKRMIDAGLGADVESCI